MPIPITKSAILALWLYAIVSAIIGARIVAAQTQVEVARLNPPTNPTPLGMFFVDWNALETRPVQHGQTRPIWDNPAPGFDKIKMHSTTLLPSLTTHSPHRHAFEEFCFVKEGEIQLSINGKRHRMKAGSLGFFASNDAHGIENTSDKPATYFVCIMPSPAARNTPDIAAEDQNVPGMLKSTVYDCESMSATNTAFGSVTAICDSPTLTLSSFASQLVTLNAGQATHPETSAAESAIVFVKAGYVEVIANRVTNRISADSFFYCPPGDKPMMKNVGATPATFLVVRFSPR
jgi:XRE family transcriptional regulator, regulator of sulfur utilization